MTNYEILNFRTRSTTRTTKNTKIQPNTTNYTTTKTRKYDILLKNIKKSTKL